MHEGKLVFAQLMLYLPLTTFRRCVADNRGEHKCPLDSSGSGVATCHLHAGTPIRCSATRRAPLRHPCRFRASLA